MSGNDIRRIDWAAVMIRAAIATASAARPKSRIVDGVASVLPAVFEHYGVTTLRRQAHFISQAIVECAYFQTLEEYASGDAYDQRTDLGFTAAKDGDGRTNKGFGIFQNTGPTNQRRVLKVLKSMGFDVTQDVSHAKSVLTDPVYAAWAAGIFWGDNKLNAVADQDPTGKLMGRAINRGNWRSGKPANGEAERLKAFRETWKELQNPRMLKGARVVSIPAGVDPADLREIVLPGQAPWSHFTPPVLMPGERGSPINRDGMTAEESARLDANRIADTGDGVAVFGHTDAIEQGPAPGMDPDEHANQVAAGDTPDAAPPSPSVPLPAEPVAPGHPEALVQATQARMRERGFYPVGTPDGDPSYRTVMATSGLQAVAGLPVTGQLDAATMAVIWSDDCPRAPVSFSRGMTTVEDLRGKSRIVDDADKVKTASIWQIGLGTIAAGGTSLVSGLSSTWSSLAEVRQMFEDVPGWAWGLVALALCAGPAAYAYWKAHQVQVARVQDQVTGKTN